ncbi:MAG: hypothetical protein R3345_07145, partial [Fulvivirga sp.]|nr:hypothetical protein [Fulvivirga sp.]
LSEFVFQPYKRNRFGRFEPVRNKTENLNVCLNRNDQEWDTHKRYILQYLEDFIDQLKVHLSRDENKKEETVSVSDDW